jgi:hypothetical protein
VDASGGGETCSRQPRHINRARLLMAVFLKLTTSHRLEPRLLRLLALQNAMFISCNLVDRCKPCSDHANAVLLRPTLMFQPYTRAPCRPDSPLNRSIAWFYTSKQERNTFLQQANNSRAGVYVDPVTSRGIIPKGQLPSRRVCITARLSCFGKITSGIRRGRAQKEAEISGCATLAF